MKKVFTLLLPALFLTALPVAVHAEGSVDATTIVRIEQDNRSGFDKRTLAPATQFLGVDLEHLGGTNLSAHLFGWGRQDLADPSDTDGRSEGSLTYGYLQYRLKQANANARLGRFFVNEGIVSEEVDGASAATDLPFGFGLSAFGGATVHTDHLAGEDTDGKGNAQFGGRASYRLRGLLELGLSGVYETKAPTLVSHALAGKFGDHRLVGGDLWFAPYRMVQLMGHTSYNTETSTVAEHSYLLNVSPVQNLTVSGSYDEHHDRDLFYSSILFATLLRTISEESRAYGASASYALNSGVDLSADFKEYERDFGRAQRFGGEVRGNFLKNALRSGVAYHYLRSGSGFAIIPVTGASGSFQEARAYALYDSKKYFSSLDVIGYFFKTPVDNRDNAWETTGSLGFHLTPKLSLSGDVSYGQNALFNDEVRGVLRLTYNTTVGKGEAK